mmetsp:Transcript_139563/g.242842  ORF Transcript_139563/g.242842 Transcript_139563/m.242842 type:complete len:138 (-) Transcript_139563:2055-2468(-)
MSCHELNTPWHYWGKTTQPFPPWTNIMCCKCAPCEWSSNLSWWLCPRRKNLLLKDTSHRNAILSMKLFIGPLPPTLQHHGPKRTTPKSMNAVMGWNRFGHCYNPHTWLAAYMHSGWFGVACQHKCLNGQQTKGNNLL